MASPEGRLKERSRARGPPARAEMPPAPAQRTPYHHPIQTTKGQPPRWPPRPPATTKTTPEEGAPKDSILHNDPFRDAFMEESDDNISLRKEYKRILVAVTKAKSHMSFVAACKAGDQTPKGLHVNVRCSAFLANLMGVKEKFKHTSKQAEHQFISHLDEHYQRNKHSLQTRCPPSS